jgi:hypothetical protein
MKFTSDQKLKIYHNHLLTFLTTMHLKLDDQKAGTDLILSELIFKDTFNYLRNKMSIYQSSFKTLIDDSQSALQAKQSFLNE